MKKALSNLNIYSNKEHTDLFLNRLKDSFRNAVIRNITATLSFLLLASIINTPSSQAEIFKSSNQTLQPFKMVKKASAVQPETDKSIIVTKLADEASKVSPTSHPELKENIANIVESLNEKEIATPRVIAYALATAERETAKTFKPIEEYGGPQQAIVLGYSGGENYYGRGYIQITHDYNYKEIGEKIGMGDQLVNNPELALDPEVASKILAEFFKEKEVAAKAEADFVAARGPINGTDHAETIAHDAEKYLQAIEQANTESLADNRALLAK